MTCTTVLDSLVAPFTGAWIEIRKRSRVVRTGKSLPSRERGLKSQVAVSNYMHVIVAPFTGAWIEIGCGRFVWRPQWSLPSRERGLK